MSWSRPAAQPVASPVLDATAPTWHAPVLMYFRPRHTYTKNIYYHTPYVIKNNQRVQQEDRHFSGTTKWNTFTSYVPVSLPAYLICQLQSILNAATHIIYHLRSTDYITNALISLTSCGSQSAYNTSWLFWHTWSYMEVCHLTLVHVSTLLISVMDERSILLASTILLCHQSTVTEALVLCPQLKD